jgi:hypothetical protein
VIFPIKVIYVAGPISAPTKEGREANIERGRAAGANVYKLGAMPMVPHLNSMGMLEDEKIPVETIYLGDLALLQRCDAVLRLKGWESSQGVNYEVAWARHLKIPIFDDLATLELWLNG